jgi:hypothetical protein
MARKSIRVQEEVSNYTLEGVVKFLKAIQKESGGSLRRVKDTQRLDREKLHSLKDEVSPFAEGDRVVCHWGSSGFTMTGTVVDSLVKYNGYMKWSKSASENACIVRLDERTLPTGVKASQNEVIPWRCIKDNNANDCVYHINQVAKLDNEFHPGLNVVSVDLLYYPKVIVHLQGGEEVIEKFKKEITNHISSKIRLEYHIQ